MVICNGKFLVVWLMLLFLQSHCKVSNDRRPSWFDELFGEEEYSLYVESQRNSIFFEHESKGSSFFRSNHRHSRQTLKPSSVWKIGELLHSHNEFIDMLSISDRIDEICPQISNTKRQSPILFRPCTGNFTKVLALAVDHLNLTM